MPKDMSDTELKEAMKTIARIAGLNLNEERIDIDLSAFKSHLAAADAVSGVELALEDEPSFIFQLKKQTRK